MVGFAGKWVFQRKICMFKPRHRNCPGSCICNFFMYNCDPCTPDVGGNCPVEAQGIQVQQAADEASDGPCADYNEWMFGMTQEERVRELAEHYCIDDDGPCPTSCNSPKVLSISALVTRTDP